MSALIYGYFIMQTPNPGALKKKHSAGTAHPKTPQTNIDNGCYISNTACCICIRGA